MRMNYCWLFTPLQSIIESIRVKLSFQQIFIEYFVRLLVCTTSHPLCELSPASPGRTSCTHCSQLFCWPRGVGLWSPVQHLCMHNSERQGDQWEMGATGGILLSSSPRGLFWAAISTHSWGWFYEVTWTFVLRTPFPPFCSSGISFSRQRVEKAFVSGSGDSRLRQAVTMRRELF